MHKGKQALYSRNFRQWIPVTVHRAGSNTAPNSIHISDGYMTGTFGFPVPAIRLVASDGTEKWRGIGGYNPAVPYVDGDRIEARIIDLSQISVYYVRYNQVKEIPFDLGLLVNTRTIGLRMNYIAGLGHLNLENLHLLENLDVSGNPSVTGITLSATAPINFYYLQNTGLDQSDIDYIIEMTVARGITGGSMSYDGRPSYEQWENYDTLVARGWNMSLSPLAGTTEILGYTKAGTSNGVLITASHRITFNVRNADGTLRYTGKFSAVHTGDFPDFVEDGWIETEYYHPSILSMKLDGKRLKTLQLAQYINATNLNFDNNFVSTVVLTSNTKLESLSLRNNPITSLSGITATKLTYLDLRDTSLTATGIDSILGNLVTVGTLNGTFHYSVRPTPAAVANYDILASRGWLLSLEPPRAASNLTVVSTGTTSASLSWTKGQHLHTVNESLDARVVGTTTWFNYGSESGNTATITDLQPNTSYEFRIGSVWNDLEPFIFSNIATGTTASAPTPSPFTLSNGTVTPTSVPLTWTVSQYAETYRVNRYNVTDGGVPVVLASGLTGLSYTDNTVISGKAYQYTVDAINESGITSSNTLAVNVPLPAPTAATNLVFTNVLNNTLTISFTAGANTTGHRVLWRVAGSGSAYNSDTAATNIATTTRNITGLAGNTNYEFIIRSYQGSGATVDSATSTKLTRPNAVTNLTATAAGSTQINLSWTAASGGAVIYDIERRTGSAGTWFLVGDTTNTTFPSTGLTPNTQYFYRVVSKNATGGTLSSEAVATTTTGSTLAINIKTPTEGQTISPTITSTFELNGVTGIEMTNITEGQTISPTITVNIKLN